MSFGPGQESTVRVSVVLNSQHKQRSSERECFVVVSTKFTQSEVRYVSVVCVVSGLEFVFVCRGVR
jgi:hypothetical protein